MQLFWVHIFVRTVYAEESLSEFVLDGINVTALGYEKNNLDTC